LLNDKPPVCKRLVIVSSLYSATRYRFICVWLEHVKQFFQLNEYNAPDSRK